MDRNEKEDFLARAIQKSKMVMKEVDTRHGGKSNQTGMSKKVYSEQDTDNLLVDNTRYISPEEYANMGGAQQLPKQPSFDLYSDNERQPQYEQRQVGGEKFIPYKNLNNSKMPQEILESFIAKPMINPNKSATESLFDRLAPVKPQQPRQVVEQRVQQPTQPLYEQKQTMDVSLIEYIIKKTVEETVKQLNEQTSLNENIQIKIGDKTFGGSIKSLKTIKTQK